MYRKLLKIIHDLYKWTMGFANKPYAVPALCVLAFIEASFFLIPPDVLLIAMSASQSQRAIIYAHWCTLFSVLGALFGYVLGWLFWAWIDDFFLHYILTPEQFQTVQSLFQEATFITIVLAAFTPIPFKVFTITGGVLQAPLLPFILGSVIGRGLRFYTQGVLFFIFGEKIRYSVEKHFEKVTWILGLFFLLLMIYMYLRVD